MQRVTSTPDLEAMALPTIAVVDNLVRERLYSGLVYHSRVYLCLSHDGSARFCDLACHLCPG